MTAFSKTPIHPAVIPFQEALKAAGVQTHARHAAQVTSFMRRLEDRRETPYNPREITRADLLAYVEELDRRRPYSGTSEAISMLRRFFLYQLEQGAIDISPAEGLRSTGRPGLLERRPPRDPVVVQRTSRWQELAHIEETLSENAERAEASPSATNDSGPPEAPSTPAPALLPAEGDRAEHPLLEQAIAAGWRRQGGRPSGHGIPRRSRMPDDQEAAGALTRLDDDERRRS